MKNYLLGSKLLLVLLLLVLLPMLLLWGQETPQQLENYSEIEKFLINYMLEQLTILEKSLIIAENELMSSQDLLNNQMSKLNILNQSLGKTEKELKKFQLRTEQQLQIIQELGESYKKQSLLFNEIEESFSAYKQSSEKTIKLQKRKLILVSTLSSIFVVSVSVALGLSIIGVF